MDTVIRGGRVSHALLFGHIDWVLVVPVLLLTGAGLLTMNAFVGENYFFERQVIWVLISLFVFFLFSTLDFRFLRRSWVVVLIYALSLTVLLLIFLFGETVKGAQSRFDFGAFALQPADPIKLVVIILLAKYFSRRHIEIANIRHILVSGLYVFLIFLLVFLQPDFGSAIIIAAIWGGMVFVSGISKKHLAGVFLLTLATGLMLWFYVFADYQKQRILTFVHPLTDIQGAGYNAYQSMIAVGSGGLLGKGVGYGTQSRLQFLPEYQTDFIFASFAEEWGFAGVMALFTLFGIILWRIFHNAVRGATNFETLFGLGLATFFAAHLCVHIGMNIGLLPVTGTTIPFLSYGGSHLLTEYAGLGILMAMRRYGRAAHREDLYTKEFVGM